MYMLGIKLRSPGLAASDLTNWAIELVQIIGILMLITSCVVTLCPDINNVTDTSYNHQDIWEFIYNYDANFRWLISII